MFRAIRRLPHRRLAQAAFAPGAGCRGAGLSSIPPAAQAQTMGRCRPDQPTPGAERRRHIEADGQGLPLGFSTIEDFQLFLRLLGDPQVRRPLAPICTIGRLLGLDRLSVKALMMHYGSLGVGSPPGRRSRRGPLAGLGPGHPVFEDVSRLVRRDPPVLGDLLPRLVWLPSRELGSLLLEYLPEACGPAARRPHVPVDRLRALASVTPRLTLSQMAWLLSSSPKSVARDLATYVPELGDYQPPRVPSVRLDALRAVLAAAGPAGSDASLSEETVCQRAGVDRATFDCHGPLLHATYGVRRWGELPAERLAHLRALLQECRWTLAELASRTGIPLDRIRWYIKYYEPGMVLPVPADRSVPRPLELDGRSGPGSNSMTLRDYVRAFLPPVSPLYRALLCPEPAVDPKSLITLRHLGLIRRPGHVDADRDMLPMLQGLGSLRPPLTLRDVSDRMGISLYQVRKRFVGAGSLAELRRTVPAVGALSFSEIERLRQLGEQVHPAGGRMRFTVRQIAEQLAMCPDMVFSLLHLYCPEYFFLALAPEAGSGPGGMYVPVEKVAPLLAKVADQATAPLLHQVAVDLGCTLPQVVNSLRADATCRKVPFRAPSYYRHVASRLFEIKSLLRLHPQMPASAIARQYGWEENLLKLAQPYLAAASR
ncbi:hypothetical protein H696_05961 [Fonticula alba]|uniref:Uncharacterized protein n=1 Tax=Fonticula alba TaxID=691883 RepID=A0A058Z228_FONAL|nr:hypothetical protein H696_05961 [Fonticula alba]KCV67562.1 hypothetical protein H696_05961 [Fonticula alba]|eukprot:XP_009498003.1 hypothetical protein H696_05961 [Fonticula alba]